MPPRPARPAGRARRPARGRSCAGSRAVRRRRPGPLPGRPRPARPRGAPPAGCCRSRPAPPAGPGTTAGSAHRTGAAARAAAWRTSGARAASPSRSRAASSATVGASNTVADGQLHPRLARTRLTSRVASSEWPPSSKKWSSMPTRGSARTSAKRSQRTCSSGVRGARYVSPWRWGAGRALRSSLPLGVSGRASSTTNADGTMYSGSRSARWRRRAAASGVCPGAGTT